MIICFTAHVSDGRNANLEEVQSLDFLATSFHSALTFHVVPLQRLRAGEACLGNRGVDRSQISPLATPPIWGSRLCWTTDLNFCTNTGFRSAVQMNANTITLCVFPNPELWNPNRISFKSSVRQWLIKPLVWNGGSWFWMKMLSMWDPGFLIFTRQQILPRIIICLHSKSPEW